MRIRRTAERTVGDRHRNCAPTVFRVLPLLLVCLLLTTANTFAAVAQTAGEYQIKAAFLQNLAKFIDWPPDTFADPRDPFVICVLGQDPFREELDMAVKGRTVNNRQYLVKRVSKVQDIANCQIVFVSASEKKHLEPILARLTSIGILTVGDTDGFIRSGGIINFVVDEGRIRCEINAEAAERARLKISSKLLGVAHIVSGQGKS